MFLRRQAETFFAALRFFTRLPVPAWVGHSAEQLNHAARWFPAVGWIVGAIGAAVTLAAAQLWPAAIAVLLGMAATLLVTRLGKGELAFAALCGLAPCLLLPPAQAAVALALVALVAWLAAPCAKSTSATGKCSLGTVLTAACLTPGPPTPSTS